MYSIPAVNDFEYGIGREARTTKGSEYTENGSSTKTVTPRLSATTTAGFSADHDRPAHLRRSDMARAGVESKDAGDCRLGDRRRQGNSVPDDTTRFSRRVPSRSSRRCLI